MWLHKVRALWVRTVRSVFAGARFKDRGTVTAEFAVVFPAAIVVVAAVLSLTQVVMTQLDCQDAARQAAIAVTQMSQSGQLGSDPGAEAQRIAHAVSKRVKRSAILWDRDSFTIQTQCAVVSNVRFLSGISVSGSARGVRNENSEEIN